MRMSFILLIEPDLSIHEEYLIKRFFKIYSLIYSI